jgi:hypothetical protein
VTELPPELAALARATGEDEQRRALEAALAIVVLVHERTSEIAVGTFVAVSLGLVSWHLSGRWLIGGIVACALLPLAARAWRRLQLTRLRRHFARDRHFAWRAAALAWQRATPGQRAALVMITRPPA